MQLESYHIYGAVFLAYIVIKEAIVLIKGDSRLILNTLIEMKKIHETFTTDIKDMSTRISAIYNTQDKKMTILEGLNQKETDLWEWHNKEDVDGVKVWYIRRGIDNAMEKLIQTIDKQNSLLVKQSELIGKLVEKVHRLDSDMEILRDSCKYLNVPED